MSKLKSMVDYVLENHGIKDPIFYAKFITQPLEKWMFVPCDEDGNILEDITGQGMIPYYVEKVHRFLTAKERVIFEGFQATSIENGLMITNGINTFYFWDNKEIHYSERYATAIPQTIEDIIKYKIEVTESIAKKYNL